MNEAEEAALAGLYIVATPIGNLGDLTRRAADILTRCDVIACEDTRQTAKLLRSIELSKPMLSYHEHNEQARTVELVERLKTGQVVALVSDAGTPLVSDPGFRIVRECRREGIPVTPVPGPCALTAALSASGLPSHRFLFAGFLPPKTATRRRFFEAHLDDDLTLIFYESNHRIRKFIDDAIAIFGGERYGCVAREITKRHETFYVARLDEIHQQLPESSKGEFVILIAPSSYNL